MARTTSLTRRRLAARLALIGALVVGAHLLVLDWVAGVALHPSALRQMDEPMFTRLLQPQAPPSAPPTPASEPNRPPARTQSRQIAIESIAEPARPAASAPNTVEASKAQAPPAPAAAPPPAQSVAQPAPAADPLPASEPPTSAPADVAAAQPPPPPPPASAPNGESTATSTGPDPAANPFGYLDSWPRDTRVNYQLSGKYRSGDLYGGARVQWQRAGPLYQARVDLDITLAGSRVLTSQGEVTADGLRPDVFEEVWRGKPRSVRMGPTTLTFNDGRIAPRPAGVQDSASQFVELSHRFATGRERLEVGRSVNIWLARPSAVDLWTYDIVERELLRTPKLGEVEAFRLKPRPIANPRGNITAEIWFAPTLQYLPVRIRVSMGDEAHVDLMVDTIEQR